MNSSTNNKQEGNEMFKTGQTYTTRSICDHDCIISATIIKRTEKTITTEVRGEVKSFRVKKTEDGEFFYPWGNYSMSPVIRSN